MHKLKLVITTSYLILSGLGLVMLWSITPDRLAQQALLLFIGLLSLLYLGNQDLVLFKQFALPIYFVALILLLSTFMLGDIVRGSVRWIEIAGFRLQPSELVKPLLVISFAYFLEKYPPVNIKNIILNICTFLVPSILIFRQPDLGTALVVASIWVAMIFFANISWILVALGGIATSILAYLSPHFLHDYQLDRLRTFFDPYHDPLGSGYNVIQAIIAVGSGQIFGKGLGHGTQSHFRFLPERHTDFMFASLSEELGLVGASAVVIVFAIILYHILDLLLAPIPIFHRLVLVGVFACTLFQFAVNIGMNIGLAPVTGVTLPLISYGGSSALATAILFGLAVSAGSVNFKKPVVEIK